MNIYVIAKLAMVRCEGDFEYFVFDLSDCAYRGFLINKIFVQQNGIMHNKVGELLLFLFMPYAINNNILYGTVDINFPPIILEGV